MKNLFKIATLSTLILSTISAQAMQYQIRIHSNNSTKFKVAEQEQPKGPWEVFKEENPGVIRDNGKTFMSRYNDYSNVPSVAYPNKEMELIDISKYYHNEINDSFKNVTESRMIILSNGTNMNFENLKKITGVLQFVKERDGRFSVNLPKIEYIEKLLIVDDVDLSKIENVKNLKKIKGYARVNYYSMSRDSNLCKLFRDRKIDLSEVKFKNTSEHEIIRHCY